MKFSIEKSKTAKKIVNNMTLDQAIRQICCPSYYGLTDDMSAKDFEDAGGVFFPPAQKAFHKKAIDIYKSVCDIPPLVTTDFEEGAGKMIKDATKFPFYAGITATKNKKLVYEVGKTAAIEGREAGFNWTLAPCIDLLNNPDTPTTSTRSAGRDPATVIKYSKEYIKGCQDYGLLATAKHFPGDGFGVYDQHLTTPEIPLTKEKWDATSGRVYREIIDAGVMTIMPGHLSFPDIDKKESFNGLYPPATLSKRLLTNLLKKELGFEGLIISDAIGMNGMVGFMNKYDAFVRFWEAGGDMLLFANPTKNFLEKMKERIKNGTFKESTIYDRAYRIVSLKDQLGILNNDKKTAFTQKYAYSKQEHLELSRKVIHNSIDLVRDRKNYLPIKNPEDKKILHIVLANDTIDAEIDPVNDFTKTLKTKFGRVDTLKEPQLGSNKLAEIAESKKYDYIICSVACLYKHGTNVIRLHGRVARHMMQGWVHLGTPAIFIAHFHHLLHLEYQAVIDCVINTYGTVPETKEPLLKFILGKKLDGSK